MKKILEDTSNDIPFASVTILHSKEEVEEELEKRTWADKKWVGRGKAVTDDNGTTLYFREDKSIGVLEVSDRC